MLSYSSDSANVTAYKSEYLGFKSAAHMYDETRLIYDRLARQLGSKPCFFHGDVDDDTTLAALDILIYAHLKYQLVNASDSKEVLLLRQTPQYEKLLAFVARIDARLQKEDKA